MPNLLTAGTPSDEVENWELSNAKLVSPLDPPAAIMILSEEERVVLFTWRSSLR
jgi:hypothetical protein